MCLQDVPKPCKQQDVLLFFILYIVSDSFKECIRQNKEQTEFILITVVISSIHSMYGDLWDTQKFKVAIILK